MVRGFQMLDDNHGIDVADALRLLVADGDVPAEGLLDELGVRYDCPPIGCTCRREDVLGLADIIDPTCRVRLRCRDGDFNPGFDFVCSECGLRASVDTVRLDDGTEELLAYSSYCRWCGARVAMTGGEWSRLMNVINSH